MLDEELLHGCEKNSLLTLLLLYMSRHYSLFTGVPRTYFHNMEHGCMHLKNLHPFTCIQEHILRGYPMIFEIVWAFLNIAWLCTHGYVNLITYCVQKKLLKFPSATSPEQNLAITPNLLIL